MAALENLGTPVMGDSEMTMNCRQIAKKSTAKLAVSALKACGTNKSSMDSEGESDSGDDSDVDQVSKEVQSRDIVSKITVKNGVIRTARKSMKPSALAEQQVAAMKEKQEQLKSVVVNGISGSDSDSKATKSVSECNGSHDDVEKHRNDSDSLAVSSNGNEQKGDQKDQTNTKVQENSDIKPVPVIKDFSKIKMALKSVSLDNGSSNKDSDDSARPVTPSIRDNLFDNFESKRSRPNTPNDSSRPSTPNKKAKGDNLEKSQNGAVTTDLKTDENSSKCADFKPADAVEEDSAKSESMNKEDVSLNPDKSEIANKEGISVKDDENSESASTSQDSCTKQTDQMEEDVPSPMDTSTLDAGDKGALNTDGEKAVSKLSCDKKVAHTDDNKENPAEDNKKTQSEGNKNTLSENNAKSSSEDSKKVSPEENKETLSEENKKSVIVENPSELKTPSLGPGNESSNKKPIVSSGDKLVKPENKISSDKSKTESLKLSKTDSPVNLSSDVICLSDSDDDDDKGSQTSGGKKSEEKGHKIIYPSKGRKRPVSEMGPEQNIKRSRIEVGKSGENNKHKRAITLSPEDLQNMIEKRLVDMVRKQTQALVVSFKNKIDELQKSNDKWKDKAKDLQKQILDLSIKHQTATNSNSLYGRSITKKNIQMRSFQSQCDQEMIRKSTTIKPTAPKPVVTPQKTLAPAKPAQQTQHSASVVRTGSTSITIPSNLRPGTYLVSGSGIRQSSGPTQQTPTASAVIDLTMEDERSRVGAGVKSSPTTVKELIKAKNNSNQVNPNLVSNQRLVQLVNPPMNPAKPVYVQNAMIPANRYVTNASTPGVVTLLRTPGMNTMTTMPPGTMMLPTQNQVQRMQIVGGQLTQQVPRPPTHPAPLPVARNVANVVHPPLPKPDLQIKRVPQGIVLSWNMTINDKHPEIVNYQLFAYQETNAAPSTILWKKVGDVKALPLPMACTLTQFQEGNKYHFAVRAIDVHGCQGMFSSAASIHLMLSRVGNR